MPSPPRLYFSFRSPFSWLLVARLRRIVPDAFERIELIPYWEPDDETAAALAQQGAAIRYAAMSKAKHLYILQDVKRLATGLGLSLRWPVDVAPWWEPAHLGWLVARRAGRAAEFYDEIVAARWGRGEDISLPEVVARAAAGAGVDPDAVRTAHEDPRVRAEGSACLARAYQDDVFGVPYLFMGWRRFWGYDRLDAFLAASGLAPVATDPASAYVPPTQFVIPAVVVGQATAAEDAAGGCG